MEVVDQESVFLDQFPFGVAPHEFLVEAITLGGLVVGRCDVFDGYRFRAVDMSYPVGVGQVHADGGRRVAVAGENGGGDDFGRDAFYLFFLECRVGGRVVFEPLCVGADDFGAVRGFKVFEVDNRLPAAFQPDGVAVDFDESVDEVDARVEVGHPLNRVFVEGFEVAGAVIVDEQVDDLALLVVLGHGRGFFEPVDDFFDGCAVVAAYTVHLFIDFPVAFYQAAVESERGGHGVAGGLHGIVESLGFGLCHAVVVVAGRCGDEVFAGGEVHALGEGVGVEDDRADVCQQFIGGSALLEGQALGRQGAHGLFEEALAELGREFVGRVVVVDTVGKPHLFQVFFQCLEVGTFFVACVLGVDGFEGAAYGQVPFAVLVEEYVASLQGGFGEVVDEFFLLERELFKARYLVAEYFEVGKLLDRVVERFGV